MIYEKPRISVNQNFLASSTATSEYLPAVLVGPRYDVIEDTLLTAYDGTEVTATYPEIVTGNVVDTSYISILAKSASLQYYANSHTWKKNGRYSNKIRTILSDNLRFLPGEDSTFKSRGVVVGDRIKAYRGSTVVDTTVTAIEADMSTPTTGASTANAGNTPTQAHLVDTAASGPGQSAITPTSGGTYTGDLYGNVTTDTYTIFTSIGGTSPVTSVDNGTWETAEYTVAITGVFDASIADVYTLTVVTGGAIGDCTYSITSNNLDNSGLKDDLAAAAPLALGSKGLLFTLTSVGGGSLTAGTYFKVTVTPSACRLRITTNSGTDQVSSRVFPGFGTAFTVGTRGVTLSLAGSTMVAGFYWTIECDKQLAAVTSTSAGTYTGSVNKIYFVKCVQGGTFAESLVEITNSVSTTRTVKSVVAHSTPVTIGEGVTLSFANNVQGGLILNDVFSISCTASAATYYRTLVLADSMPTSFDTPTISAVTKTGTNTCVATTTVYDTTNPSLELYTYEDYTVQVTTAGISGVAKAILVSSSGYDNVITPFTITTGSPMDVGAYDLKLTFAIVGPAVEFLVTDTWTFRVSKVDVTVDLFMEKSSVALPVDYYTATTSNVTIAATAKVIEPTWSTSSELTIDHADMYITYRALHTAGANTLYSITSSEDIASYLGTDHIDNPIARGARFALDICAAQSFKAIYPSSTGYAALLSKLEYYDDQNAYHIALLTDDSTVIASCIAHVNKMVSKNKWRRLFCSRSIPTIFDVVSGTCTIVENVLDPGKYTIVRTEDSSFASVSSGNTFNFLGAEYTVDTVNSSTELKLVEDVGSAQPIATPYTITKVPTTADKVSYIAAISSGYNNRFITHCFPNVFNAYEESHPGYFGTAVVAGLKAGLPAHQPMTNTPVACITDVMDMVNTYSEDDLDTIAGAGTLIFTQDYEGGIPYIRHQLTTDMSDVKHQEISIVDNVNDICFGLLGICEPYVGRYNIHPGVLQTIEAQIGSYLFSLTGTTNEYAGPQITNYENLSVTQDPGQEDKLLISVRVYCPAPINYIDITLTV